MSPLFSNRQSRAGTLVTASMCTAIAVVFSVIGLYIPVFSTLVFLIVPIPIAYMCLMGNMKWGVAVCVAVLLLDSLLFGVMSGAFASSVFCLLGLTLGYGYRKKYSAATILALGTLVSAAVFGAQVFFASAFMGFDCREGHSGYAAADGFHAFRRIQRKRTGSCPGAVRPYAGNGDTGDSILSVSGISF